MLEITWPKMNIYSGEMYRIASPAEKMPDCPNCGEDELSLISTKTIFCNSCCMWFHEKKGKLC